MTNSSSEEHREQAAAATGQIRIAIVTVSDSRTLETDVNGHYLQEEITAGGHQVVAYRLIKDEPEQVADVLEELGQSPAQIILFNGGTGISPRDRTFDVLDRHLEKKLPGFGELFRMLSWEQVGAAAMLSRATAGVYKNRVIISTPGSPNAVRLAWEKLVAPELAHLAWDVVR
jgi:molybdenum cofactor biosynthesis protein B